MDNDYAPQGTFAVGDRIVWDSEVVTRFNDLDGIIIRVIHYGDIMDLYHVVFDGETVDNYVPALSNDFRLKVVNEVSENLAA